MGDCKACTLYMLPLLPSALVQQALSDFEECEREEAFATDPTQCFGHDILEDKVGVGLSGAVLVRSLGQPIDKSELFWSASELVAAQIYAIGWFAKGEISTALREFLGITLPEGVPDRVALPDYQSDPEGYKDSIRRLINLLASNGL